MTPDNTGSALEDEFSRMCVEHLGFSLKGLILFVFE
jgi:hypothetical protein